jgi:F0F1-type ATP synthase delta subunit
MEEKILDKILINTYTMASLKRRLKALKSRLSEQFFGGDTNKEMVIEETNWLNTYGVQFLSDFQKETFYQSIGKIEQLVNQIKPLTVYISFPADEESIKNIGIKVRETYSQKVVIDLKYDPDLIGGCAFIWNGVYRDYSIRNTLKLDREKLLESFKSFLAAKK